MPSFMREKSKNNSEEILWYSLDYDLGYILQVYRAEICSNKIKQQRRIYWKSFLYSNQRKEKINWWEKQGAISEEEFALKYK